MYTLTKNTRLLISLLQTLMTVVVIIGGIITTIYYVLQILESLRDLKKRQPHEFTQDVFFEWPKSRPNYILPSLTRS